MEKTKAKKNTTGRRIIRIIGKGILCILGMLVIFCLAKALLWGRWNLQGKVSGEVPAVSLSYEEAMADGKLSDLELAEHFAPKIYAAVNVLLSDSGRGDFIAAVDFDGDMAADNNWENMTKYPLEAVIYYSVQETETHYFIGYNFYHPRDDAEIWLDRHENDLEGIMLSIRKQDNSFGTIEVMYTQGHGYVPFYFNNADYSITEGSKHDGTILLDEDHPVIYITPNGTLRAAGHSVESAADHSLYWSVLNSGICYYYGGIAEEPATFKGSYENNRCSYSLTSLDFLWNLRNGAYGSGHIFAEFGAFCGDNYGTNSANPPWGWRNKTAFGYGGSFLSDPVWTISHAIDGISDLSASYLRNPYADFLITVNQITLKTPLPENTVLTVSIYQGDWCLSNSSWWSASVSDGILTYPVSFGNTNSIYVAAPKDTKWRVEVTTASGETLTDEQVVVDWSLQTLTN